MPHDWYGWMGQRICKCHQQIQLPLQLVVACVLFFSFGMFMKLFSKKTLTVMAGLIMGSAYAMLPVPSLQALPNLSGWGVTTPANLANIDTSATAVSPETPSFSSPVLQAKLPNPPLQLNQTTTQPLLADKLDTAIFAFLVQGNTLVPIDASMILQSGDVVEYQAYLTNRTGEHMRSATAVFHIPTGVQLLNDISPVGYFVSSDGVNFGRATANAPQSTLDTYKALLWNVQDVGIDGVAVVKYRAKIQ